MRNLFINLKNQLVDGSGEEINMRDYQGASDLIVWVPSERITLLEANIPTRNASDVEQSLPYALEDELLEDIADLHFAWNITPANTPIPVAVVSRKLMQLWLDLLKPLNALGYHLVPDVFCLPQQQGNATTVWYEQDRAIARTGKFSGFAGTKDALAGYMKANDLTPVGYHLSGTQGIQGIAAKSNTTARKSPTKVPQDTTGYPCLPVYQPGGAHEYINLLQGDYQAGATLLRIMRKSSAALLGAALLMVLLAGHQIVGYLQLRKELAHVQQQLVTQAREIIPDYQQGTPVRLLVSRFIANQQQEIENQGSQPFFVLEQVVPLLSKCRNCVFNLLEFNQEQIQIEIGSYLSLDELDKQLQTLTEYKVQTEPASSDKNENQYHTLTLLLGLPKNQEGQ